MSIYVLTGQTPNAPQYMRITTDDDGLIIEFNLPFYRQSDAVRKQLIADWETYAEAIGSPSAAQDIVQFKQWIADTYGQTYMVRQLS